MQRTFVSGETQIFIRFGHGPPPANICFCILSRSALRLVANLSVSAAKARLEVWQHPVPSPVFLPKLPPGCWPPRLTPVPAVPSTRGDPEHRGTWPPWQNAAAKSEIQTTARQGAQPHLPLNVLPPTSVGLLLRETAAQRSSLPQPPLFSPQISCLACCLRENFISWITCSYHNYRKDLGKQAVKTNCIYFKGFFWLVTFVVGCLFGLVFCICVK